MRFPSVGSDVPLIIQITGPSGSGKTTAIERSVRRLATRGLRVGVIKHSHHIPDLRGKDSARYRAAGATAVLFRSTETFLLFDDRSLDLLRALPVDVLLVEGYSRRRFGGPRVRVRGVHEIDAAVRQILAASPRRRTRTRLSLDGASRVTDPLWTFVHHLMSVRNVREVVRP